MLFNSLHFCIFFPIATFCYFFTPHAYRWMVLLVASGYFYMSWNPLYGILIGICIIANYWAALLIDTASTQRAKRGYLTFSMVISLGMLFIFKYYMFVHDSYAYLVHSLGYTWTGYPLNLILPVGISFFTFQAMSYTIDVYSGSQKAEPNAGKVALFVLFFPQLVAGPIERAGNLLDQCNTEKFFRYDNAIIGLRTFLGGLILKLLIADNLSKYVNAVYNDVYSYTGWPLLFATYLFAFQIFADFAGYTYMAIGIAKILDFSLMENFKHPYISASISEFWRRWHISLSTWV